MNTTTYTTIIWLRDNCTCFGFVHTKLTELDNFLKEHDWDIDVYIPKDLPPCPTHKPQPKKE